MQDDAEKRRTCDAAAAEVQGILQGRALPRGGPYVPPPRAAFNAVGPPSQVPLAEHLPKLASRGGLLVRLAWLVRQNRACMHAAVEETRKRSSPCRARAGVRAGARWRAGVRGPGRAAGAGRAGLPVHQPVGGV